MDRARAEQAAEVARSVGVGVAAARVNVRHNTLRNTWRRYRIVWRMRT